MRMKKRSLEEGPDPDVEAATARLSNIRPAFVSIVDVPANLRPFLVLKGMTMEHDPNLNLILPTDVKDALVGTLGTATTMLGSLLTHVRDAGETSEPLASPIPAQMTQAISEVVALLSGTGISAPQAPRVPVVEPMQLERTVKSALAEALEKALAKVLQACESIEKAAGKVPSDFGSSLHLASELLRSQIARAETVRAARTIAEGLPPRANPSSAAPAASPQAPVPCTSAQPPSTALPSPDAPAVVIKDASPADEPPPAAMAAATTATSHPTDVGAPAARAPAEAGTKSVADLAKAGAVFSRKNRQLLEEAFRLLGEALEQARMTPLTPNPPAGDAATNVSAPAVGSAPLAATPAGANGPPSPATPMAPCASETQVQPSSWLVPSPAAPDLARDNAALKKSVEERDREITRLRGQRAERSLEPLDGPGVGPRPPVWSSDITLRRGQRQR
jgi:2-oxoglutarate dehydrogenase E2 component (dihydrolipoamide succinyltransferase)